MNLEGVLNGAGSLVVVSAPFMLAGVLLRDGAIARLLRRVAVLLAAALPILFIVGTVAFYLNQGGPVFFDFEVNHQATSILYGAGGDPYSVHAAYSFPFPTFYLYWAFGGFGSLNAAQAWREWWLVNGVIWIIGAVVLWRMLPRPGSSLERDARLYALVAIPGMTTLWQGQTALLILVGLVALHVAVLPGRARWLPNWIIGGIGLAWAALIKPQLALVGFGVALWGLLAGRARRYDDTRRVIGIVLSAALAALALLILTLILPSGVTLDTYRQFAAEALPQVARPADGLVIGSPAFVAGAAALTLGASDRSADLIANAVTVLVLAFAVWWTVRRADHPLVEIAAGWGVWAMVAPRVAWMWYAAWCLPFFLLTICETLHQRRSLARLALIVIVVALVNLQLDSLAVALGTILLLIALLWTSFSGVGNP